MIRTIGKAGMIAALAGALMLASCSKAPDPANGQRKEFSIGWSIYAGWMPWPYAQQAGIVKKWADKYGIKINVVQVNDYVESINQYTAGKFDGVTVTNMDALTIPAAGGKDTSAIIVGDYSNGNDGILLKGADQLAAIKGRQVYLVELSVSHYLLARGLQTAGLKPTDVRTVNTSDADIVGAFGSPAANAAVAWNPQLSVMKAQPGVKLDRASVYKLNQAILNYHHDDETRGEILKKAGYADNNAVLGAAVELNALDDWAAFHEEILK